MKISHLLCAFAHSLLKSSVVVCVLAATATAQQAARDADIPASAQLPILLFSDLHFDPLQDPDKVPRLAKAPLSEWPAILDSVPSPNRSSRFAAIQEACSGKGGADASWTLLHSSLVAARLQGSSAAFVMVSGDLLVHDLDCRYRMAMGLTAATKDDQSPSAAFAEKTTAFVISQVESAFPRIPVYAALGNNDSRCDHNRLDAHDRYLKASAPTVVEGLRGISAAEKTLALQTFESAGYYAVTMPAPMTNTRLLVLDDVYMMPKYANCSADNTDHQGEQEQSDWLQKQLQEAKNMHQRIWVLGHLPPVVNADATLAAKTPFCPDGRTVRYQATDALADRMAAYADTIKLGVFGHTHMDEFYLLPAEDGGVPIKVVASISPVSGNLPSFTIGIVNPGTATLADFIVYEASNTTGEDTAWTREYSFDATYNEPAFTPKPLADLFTSLQADPQGSSLASRSYQENMLKGSSGKKLSRGWSGYACGLNHPTAEGFRACACKAP